MKTYETNNGTYDIYVDFDVEEGKTLSDYAYYQHSSEITTALAGRSDEWGYCSATALAQCLALYYNDKTIVPKHFIDDFKNTFSWGNDSDKSVKKDLEDKGVYGVVDDDYENKTEYIGAVVGNKEFKGADEYASTILGTKKFDNYVSEVVESLKVGRPVITCVFRYKTTKAGDIIFDKNGYPKISTHFVTIVGVKTGVDLDNMQYTDFVMFDPGTEEDKQLTTVDNTYTEYTYYPYNYRIITPYLIDENKNFILDENGKKTTNPYYLNPIYDSKGNMFTSKESETIKEIENSINAVKGLEQHEKDRIIEQMTHVYEMQRAGTKSVTSYVTESGIRSNLKDIRSSVSIARITGFDPLIFDLDGDGYNVETKDNGANFDLDKNGFAEKINWTSRDGFLCLDLNGNGTIDNGGELFGDQTLLANGTRAKNGFCKLFMYAFYVCGNSYFIA